MLPSTYITGGVPPHVLLLCGVGVWSCAPVRNGPLLPRQGHDALGRGRRQMCLCPAAGARGRGAGGGIPVTHRSTGSPGDKVPLQSRFAPMMPPAVLERIISCGRMNGGSEYQDSKHKS